PGPVVDVVFHDAGGLTGEAQPGLGPEAELPEVAVHAGLAELLCDLDRADVGGGGDDVGDRPVRGRVRVAVGELPVVELQVVGHVEDGVGGDDPLLDGAGHGDHLVHR